MINADLAGVIGWPVRQSLSPMIHGYWLKRHSLAGAYVALPIAPENFGRCIAALPLMGFAGVNVTVPHKQSAFALASTIDDDAGATGAVNTLVFAAGGIRGLNTDVHGFTTSLRHTLGEDAAGAGPAVVVGAGGASRAVLLALARSGAREIRLINRTRDRALALANSLSISAELKIFPWSEWAQASAGARLLVNTTSLGMMGKAQTNLPHGDLSLDNLSPDAAVADIVYNPLETPLLREAKARGHRTMDGLGMLMHQAAPGFAAWFGVMPEVTKELRDILVKALTSA